MPALLLHTCCGPCAIRPIQSLQEQGFTVTGLFYNPNVHPLMEYVRRRDGLRIVADKLGMELLIKDDEYDPENYLKAVPRSSRCIQCYAFRLERTVEIAREKGFGVFSTTLLFSKYQQHEEISEIGSDLSSEAVAFHYEDFRVGWGPEVVKTCEEWGVYRQSYCGCLFSEFERYKKKLLC